MPLEPKLAPCGWRCPHRRPAFTGTFGNGNGNHLLFGVQAGMFMGWAGNASAGGGGGWGGTLN